MNIQDRYRRYFYEVYAHYYEGRRTLCIHNGFTTLDLQQETLGM